MKNENDVKTYEEQQTETIRERKIAVKLSGEDCDRLARLCGTHGLTIGELIENFIGDLCGTYSNGSDERMCAEQWFDRCWFGMFPEPTLLSCLLSWGNEPKDYLKLLDDLETAKDDKKYLEEHPDEADDEEVSYFDDYIAEREKELKEIRENWKPEKEPNMDEEIELIKKWVKERDDFINN